MDGEESAKSTDLIQVPAQVVGMNPRQDKSWKIQFETMELTGEQVKILADHFQGAGWLVFKPNGEVTLKDIPTEGAEPGTKSPSKRLHDKLYILWKEKKIKADFDSFYRTWIQRKIDEVDELLEELI